MQKRREFRPFGRFVMERELLRVAFEKKIEGIEDRHFGDEVDLDAQLARRFGECDACQIIRLRVLLPVDEMLGGINFQRVRQDAGTAMRRGTQPDDLRTQRDLPVIAVMHNMVERYVDRH